MKSISPSLQEPKYAVLSEEARVRYTDEATKLRIDKHLTDINDTITEEDIRNINTNITLEMLRKVSGE